MIVTSQVEGDKPRKQTGPSREFVAKALHTAAQTRWLSVTEIQLLLSSQQRVLELSQNAPKVAPESGSLFLYDRNLTRNYKSDHHHWIRKRSSNKIREDHVKLKVNGVNKIAGCYVHSSHVPTMHRRAYHLLLRGDLPSTPTFTNRASSLVLVHYLDTDYASMLLNQAPAPSLNLYGDEGKSLTRSNALSISGTSLTATRSERPSHEMYRVARDRAQDTETSASATVGHYGCSVPQYSPDLAGNQVLPPIHIPASSSFDTSHWTKDMKAEMGVTSRSLSVGTKDIFSRPALAKALPMNGFHNDCKHNPLPRRQTTTSHDALRDNALKRLPTHSHGVARHVSICPDDQFSFNYDPVQGNYSCQSRAKADNHGSLGDLWDSIMGDAANHLEQDNLFESTDDANQNQFEQQERRSSGRRAGESLSFQHFLMDLQSPASWE